MKREYKKPYLLVESFQLDAAIAGACKDKAGDDAVLNHGVDTCIHATAGLFGLACGAAGLENVTDLDGEFCYHGPTGNVEISTMFVSS